MPPPYGPLGRYLAAKKQRKQNAKLVQDEAQRLDPIIRQRLQDTTLAINLCRPGAQRTRLTNLQIQHTESLGAPPDDTVQAAAHWTKLGLDTTELLDLAQRSAAVTTALNTRSDAPLQQLRVAIGHASLAVQTGMAAELLRITNLDAAAVAAFDNGKLDEAISSAEDVFNACPTATETLELWVALLPKLDPLDQGIATLPYPALKPALLTRMTQLRQTLGTLGPLDIGAKKVQLTQLEQERVQIDQALEAAKLDGTTVQNANSQLRVPLIETSNKLGQFSSRPEGAVVHVPLLARLDAWRDGRESAIASQDPRVLMTVPTMGATLLTLTQEIDTVIQHLAEQHTHCTEPIQALETKLKGATPIVRMNMAAELAWVKKLAAEVQARIDAANWVGFAAVAQAVEDECDELELRVESLTTIEAMPDGLAKERAKMENVLVRARKLRFTLRAHTDYGTAFTTLDTHPNSGLSTHITYDTWLLAKAPPQTPATLVELQTYLPRLIASERKARMAIAAYQPYLELRQEVEAALVELGNHPQAPHLLAERTQITLAKDLAHTNGPTTGWSQARVILRPLAARCALLKEQAARLALQVTQLPALTLAVTEKGLDPRFATAALKILAEEGCSVEQAVAMAESASTYEGEGLSELDALASARAKQSLVTGDGAVPPERAHAICKLVRARGSATIEDVKAVALELKRVPPGAITAFNANVPPIENVIFRGSVTEARPEDHDTLPRGWPLDKTWDDCPGMGGPTTIYVGTMDDGVDDRGKPKRKIPGPSEGPVQHGTPDLLGHEAGHTFDAMGTGGKRNARPFVDARQEEVDRGTDEGLKPDRDNYFMTNAETISLPENKRSVQTEDAARSETFAESFALHCKGNATRWPRLMEFWTNYTW